jgi:hypothetical protein
MRDFGDFRNSLSAVWPKALALQEKTTLTLSELEWSNLKAIFQGIRCMASGTSLVGNSKVMAHLLPNLVPPVDREYTLKLLYGHGQIVNGLDRGWTVFRQILSDFFYPLAQMPIVRARADEWMQQRLQYRWDTSVLKILDNLVIGYTKMPRPA